MPAVAPASGSAGVSVLTPVQVKVAHGTISSVVVSNRRGKRVSGAMSADRTSWRSTEPLGYGKTYTTKVTTAGSPGFTGSTYTSKLSTVIPATQVRGVLYPFEGTIGVGQPIVVNFDHPVTDKAAAEQALHVTTSPHTKGSWGWISSTRVEWRPVKYWKPGTKVNVKESMYGVKLGKTSYGSEDVTGAFTVHDSWVAVGSVADHTLAAYHNGKLVKVLPASFGKGSTPTHNGPHVVESKTPLYLMNSSSYGVPANAPGGYANFKAYWAERISDDGEFVHVNQDTVGDQGNTNVSHGCINLSMAHGKWFYDHFNPGDIVDVHGGTPQLPIWDGYGVWNVSFGQWQKLSALH